MTHGTTAAGGRPPHSTESTRWYRTAPREPGWRWRWRNPALATLLALLPWTAAAHAVSVTTGTGIPASSGRAIDVLHYNVRLDPDLADKTLRGRAVITFAVGTPGVKAVEFDAGELHIDAVRANGATLEFEKVGKHVRVRLPEPTRAGTRHQIEIAYHGAPRFGLEFHPERGELYTIFSTSQWLVCIDAPEERATLELAVALPAGLNAAGNGALVSKTPLGDGRELHRWQQDQPVPSFIYGFAAGRYAEAFEYSDGVALRYLSADLQPAQLRRIFTDTGDMLRFFGERAGIPYRGRYTQTLVAQTIGQELAGLALMSEAHGRHVLENPSAQALIAHEAAHQWWGNMVTCRSWNHFWLNEGFANFMAAAYLQHRFGDAHYRTQVEGWKRRLDRLRADGTDHPLVYQSWDSPSADDRAVVYQKGAYVLHLLREELGEREFWRGVRTYTRTHYGQSVTTADFRRAMERASGRDLSTFFSAWVDASAFEPAAVATPTR
ncbi:MAG: M1 family metallopeptidase [Lysobacter sp.]